MKFVIYREIEDKKRKTLVEWDQEQLLAEMAQISGDAEEALKQIIKKFKQQTTTIP